MRFEGTRRGAKLCPALSELFLHERTTCELALALVGCDLRGTVSGYDMSAVGCELTTSSANYVARLMVGLLTCRLAISRGCIERSTPCPSAPTTVKSTMVRDESSFIINRRRGVDRVRETR